MFGLNFIEDLKDWQYLSDDERRKYIITVGVSIVLIIGIIILLRGLGDNTSTKQDGPTMDEIMASERVDMGDETYNVNIGGVTQQLSGQELLNSEDISVEDKREALMQLLQSDGSMGSSEVITSQQLGGVAINITSMGGNSDVNLDDPINPNTISGPARYFFDEGMTYREYQNELFDFYLSNKDLIDDMYSEYRTQYYLDKQSKFEEALKANPDANKYN